MGAWAGMERFYNYRWGVISLPTSAELLTEISKVKYTKFRTNVLGQGTVRTISTCPRDR